MYRTRWTGTPGFPGGGTLDPGRRSGYSWIPVGTVGTPGLSSAQWVILDPRPGLHVRTVRCKHNAVVMHFCHTSIATASGRSLRCFSADSMHSVSPTRPFLVTDGSSSATMSTLRIELWQISRFLFVRFLRLGNVVLFQYLKLRHRL